MGGAGSGNFGHGGRPGEVGGSAPGGGGFNKESPGRIKAIHHKIIHDFHGKYGGAPVEHLCLYKNGVLIAESVGNGSSCRIETDPGNAKDADIVHNHPNDSPGLSPEDIYNAARYNAKSITADSNDRGSWTVTRPENGWDPARFSPQVVSGVFKQILEKERDSPATKEDILKLDKDPSYYDQATSNLAERVSERTINALGLTVEKSGSQAGSVHKLTEDTPEQALEKALIKAGIKVTEL